MILYENIFQVRQLVEQFLHGWYHQCFENSTCRNATFRILSSLLFALREIHYNVSY